ncbi:MAG: hypothetical protein WAM85_14710 [Terracidiphilus sp.]
MTPEQRARWEQEIRDHQGPLKKPADLARRALAAEDFVDSAVIGGIELSDILAGKIEESQIPKDVLEAFHAQYPQYGSSFVDAVEHLHNDPYSLMGLVSGVKGKLFEIDYADWLNHGHLPDGFTAVLAEHANNPGWDIAIQDAHGHVSELLQLKATESISYVHEAILAHPDITVVVPHELYEKLLENHDTLIGHIVNGNEALGHLNDHVAGAVDHADAAAAADDFPILGPILVIGLVIGQNWSAYRQNRLSTAELVRKVTERGALGFIAGGAGWAVGALAHEPIIGLPVSVTLRLIGGQVMHNKHRRELLSRMVETVGKSYLQLECQLPRPLLTA